MSSKWKKDFLKNFGSVPVRDLQKVTEIKKSEMNMSKILKEDLEKVRHKRGLNKVKKILDGRL